MSFARLNLILLLAPTFSGHQFFKAKKLARETAKRRGGDKEETGLRWEDLRGAGSSLNLNKRHSQCRGSSVSKQAQPYTPDLPGRPNFGGSEGCLKSQGDHGKAQLARVDGAATISVEEEEGLPDMCLLLRR